MKQGGNRHTSTTIALPLAAMQTPASCGHVTHSGQVLVATHVILPRTEEGRGGGERVGVAVIKHVKSVHRVCLGAGNKRRKSRKAARHG